MGAAAATAPLPARRSTMASSPERVGRVTGRATFDALRQTPHRVRVGPLAVAWLPPTPDDQLPRLACAIGRSAGGAVVRNRIRRRLRAAMNAVAAQNALPAGTYLIRTGGLTTELAWPELVAHLADAVQRVTVPR